MILTSILVLSVTFPATAQATSAAAPGFLLSATPTELTLTPNSVRISIINVTAVDRFNGTVDLSVNAPAGITVSPNPRTLPLQSSSPLQKSILTVNASSSAALGTYTVTITAGALGVSQIEVLTLLVMIVADTQLACGSYGTCLIVSDSLVTGPNYRSGTIHFTAAGSPGTSGFANITIPRMATSNVSSTHVLVDGVVLPGNSVTITGNGIDYFISFTFTFHSPVSVDIQLSQLSRSSDFFGVGSVLIYGGIAGIAIVIIGVVAVLTLRRKERGAITSSGHLPVGLTRTVE